MATSLSYHALLRQNRTFRRIWMGDVVSLLGDWFTTITLLATLLKLTGRAEAVSFALIAKFLPALFFGPVAGLVADRFPRKVVMVTCDVLRAVVVLGFLLVREPGDVWLAYLLTFLQQSLAAFFDPAEQAAVGSVVDRSQIVAANALQGATWSTMLALGALAGGVVAELFGHETAFAINSVTYLGSAVFMASAAIPYTPRKLARTSWGELLGIHELREGAQYVSREPEVRRVLMAKAGWGLAGGGALMLYSIFGERVFPVGKSAATSIGILYAARGLGALAGPSLARLRSGDSESALDRYIGHSFLLMVLAYGLFAVAPWIGLGALALMVVHAGASIIWTFSTSLLNLRVPDHLRGRIFATEMALHTLALTVSTWATGFALDHLGIAPRPLMGALAALVLLPAMVWRLTPRQGALPAQPPEQAE